MIRECFSPQFLENTIFKPNRECLWIYYTCESTVSDTKLSTLYSTLYKVVDCLEVVYIELKLSVQMYKCRGTNNKENFLF